ncbi:hypothetical protein C0995_000143 [Termitomyces sp. Mi166|nr:hypothetical protein C0995_000143 [Termitomyces sp. Mi166\
MIRRSPNEEFRSKCKGLIKIIRARRVDAQRNAARSLSEYLCVGDDEESPMSDITDEDVLCYALERIYRDGMSRPQFKGVASIPSTTDRADDEDLASSQADYSQGRSSMHFPESSLWDEAVKDGLLPAFPSNPSASGLLEFRSDGGNDFPIDVDFDHDQDILEEDENWNNHDLPISESFHEFNFAGPSFQPEFETDPHATALTLVQETDCSTLSSVLDLDDSDDETSFDSSQEISQYENIGFDDFAFGTIFRLPDGHVVHNESLSDQDSQDRVPHNLGMKGGSQTSSLLPSISGPLSNWKSNSMEKTHLSEPGSNEEDDLSIFPLEETNEFSPREPTDEDDLELGFLSDSTDSNHMDISFELVHKVFDNDGDSVGVVAGPPPSETTFSHHHTNLNITWPSQEGHERRMRPGFEDSDEELWNVEARGGESEPCAGSDGRFLMMELDNLIS